MAPEAEAYWEKLAREYERWLKQIAAMVGSPPIELLPDILQQRLAAAADQPHRATQTDMAALQAALSE